MKNISLIKNFAKKILPKYSINVSLFIVGAQKSGTSALNNYLTKHPEVRCGNKKEINFFNHLEKYIEGKNWYHKQFESPVILKNKSLFIDATPQYLSDLDTAEKIYSYNPNALIIILLREPVSRAFSAWNMYRQFSNLNKYKKENVIKTHISNSEKDKFRMLINYEPFLSFSEFVDKELVNNEIFDFYPNIIKRGVYVEQVKPYIDLFGIENVLIYESEYFKKNKLKVTNEVLDKLSLEHLKIDISTLKPVHSRKYESSIDNNVKEKLSEFYKPYNDKLFELIDQKFDW
jgi:hypothetical protein